ncbi:hypothetical protein C2I36_14240 [Rhodobacteraceae bacterium WD3A24]|nr:hypothetical protein C2I36_14240 [Rhodobacteraceae bacterium WD3A24]
MAQRVSGRYSPGAPLPAGGVRLRRSRVGARVNLLFVVPLPLALTGFFKGPAGLALDLAALGLLLLAAWLTREGLLAQEAYEARAVARRPAIPRKAFGAALTGAGLAVAAYSGGQGAMAMAIYAGLAAALHVAAFGPDPMRDRVPEGVDAFQSGRVARAVDEAETLMREMRAEILRIGDRRLTERVDRFQAKVRHLIRSVEGDPSRLTAARRYLGVYLQGARDATRKFADLAERGPAVEARADYEALLSDLEADFAARTDALLRGDRAALDIEIEVLRDRLRREGAQFDRAAATKQKE